MSQEKYFGQYGRIKKCAVNKASPYASPLGISYSAYITYYSEVEATLCIKACDGFKIDGRRFKATFGTSKYCNSFIKGQRCLNSDCLYLHEEGSQVDTFTREDIQHNRHIQPHNSIFPLLNVTIIKPDLLHVLPIAKIQRRRVYSEDNSSPRPKPRLYSLDISGRRELSRFGFDEDSSEEPAEVPPFIQKILARNSPSKDIAQFFASEMPELLSHK